MGAVGHVAVFVDIVTRCVFPKLWRHGRRSQNGADVVKDHEVGSFCKGVVLWSVGDCGMEGDVLIGVVSAEVVRDVLFGGITGDMTNCIYVQELDPY